MITDKIIELMTIVNRIYPNLSWNRDCEDEDIALNVGSQLIPFAQWEALYSNNQSWNVSAELTIFDSENDTIWESGRYKIEGSLIQGRVNINLLITNRTKSDKQLIEHIANHLNIQ